MYRAINCVTINLKLKDYIIQISCGCMTFSCTKNSDVHDKLFHLRKIQFHQDALYSVVLEKCRRRVWSSQATSDWSGASIHTTQFEVLLAIYDETHCPCTLQNYLTAPGVGFLQELAYTMQVTNGKYFCLRRVATEVHVNVCCNARIEKIISLHCVAL